MRRCWTAKGPNGYSSGLMDDSERQSIGEVVRAFRVASGLSRQDLVDRSAVNPDDQLGIEMLAKIEQGKKAPSPKTLRKLATGLGVDTVDLTHSVATWQAGLAGGLNKAQLRRSILAEVRPRSLVASLGGLVAAGSVAAVLAAMSPLAATWVDSDDVDQERQRLKDEQRQRLELRRALQARFAELIAKRDVAELVVLADQLGVAHRRPRTR
jgi:transcriptional regulator with XRE-family HTH domain